MNKTAAMVLRTMVAVSLIREIVEASIIRSTTDAITDVIIIKAEVIYIPGSLLRVFS
jgi:hypothetical protein